MLKQKTQDMMPELEDRMNIAGDKPKIKLYEGLESCKNSFFELLEMVKDDKDKTIRGYVLPVSPDVNIDLYTFIHKRFVSERMKLGIKMQNIAPDIEWGRDLVKNDKACMRETRLISAPKFPFKMLEINMIGSYFHYFSFDRGRMVSAIIYDMDLTAVQRAIWDGIWELCGRRL